MRIRKSERSQNNERKVQITKEVKIVKEVKVNISSLHIAFVYGYILWVFQGAELFGPFSKIIMLTLTQNDVKTCDTFI